MKIMRPTLLFAFVALASLSFTGAAHAQLKPEIVLSGDGRFAGPAIMLKETGDKDLPDTLTAARDGALAIQSVTFGAQAETSFLKGSGASVGKPVPSQVLIRRSPDRASIAFWKKLATGASFPKLIVRLAGGIVMTLENVFVTDIKISSDEQASEDLSLVYRKIKLEVFTFDKGGKISEKPAVLDWDISTMTAK